MKLTQKQELFALGLAEGKSQRRAYIDAGYSVENKTDNYIDTRAYELSRSSTIIDRLAILQKEIEEKSLWTREKAFKEYEWLMNVAKSEIEQDQLRKAYADAFISGLDGMNKMTFANDDLANKKIRKEIEMLDKKIQALEGNEVDTSMMKSLIHALED